MLSKFKADFTAVKRGTRETVIHRVLIKDATATSVKNLEVNALYLKKKALFVQRIAICQDDLEIVDIIEKEKSRWKF